MVQYKSLGQKYKQGDMQFFCTSGWSMTLTFYKGASLPLKLVWCKDFFYASIFSLSLFYLFSVLEDILYSP